MGGGRYRVAGRRSLGLSLALLGLIVVLIGACASNESGSNSSGASSPVVPSASISSPNPSAEVSHWKSQARALSKVLFGLRTLDTAWAYEPSGDLPGARAKGGILMFADLVGFKADGSVLALDWAQYYQGTPAVREARRDGRLTAEDLVYVRNVYKHVQTLRTSPDCRIVPVLEYEGSRNVPRGVVSPAKDLLTLSSYWYFDPWEAWPDHAGWYRIKAGHEAPYWVVVEGGWVTALFEIWHP